MDRSLDNSNGVSIDSSLSGDGSIFIDETGFFDFSRGDGKDRRYFEKYYLSISFILFYLIIETEQYNDN